MCTDWMISSGILVNTITAVSFCHILSFCRQKHKLQLWVALLLLNRGTELWQTFCHNQGSKLRLIRSPMRLTFSPWRLKILVYSPKWRPDFRRVKLKQTFHLILLCFHHEKCAKSHKQSQFTSKFIPISWYFQIWWIAGFLGANFAENQSVKRPILYLFLRENFVRYRSVLRRSDQHF